jgi:hypothetical protein
MVFYPTKLADRIKGIILSPLQTWKTMKKESGYALETLLFLFVGCLFAGLSSIAKNAEWVSEICIPFLSCMITSVLMRFFKLIRKINWESNFNMLVYSFFPLVWCYTLSMLFDYRHCFLPFGLIYSFILLFLSVKAIIDVSLLRCLSLTMKIILLLFSCLYALTALLSRGTRL